MPSSSKYDSFYENGSAARKKVQYETVEKRNSKAIPRRYGKNKTKVNQSKNVKTSTNKALVVLSIIFVFSMIMVITYRYNIISEKNLESQELKSELESAEANLLASKIAVEQNTNLDYIEAYAKQKLGMQKPSSSQTVYVDTSNITQVVEVNGNIGIIDNIVCKLKDTINSIF